MGDAACDAECMIDMDTWTLPNEVILFGPMRTCSRTHCYEQHITYTHSQAAPGTKRTLQCVNKHVIRTQERTASAYHRLLTQQNILGRQNDICPKHASTAKRRPWDSNPGPRVSEAPCLPAPARRAQHTSAPAVPATLCGDARACLARKSTPRFVCRCIWAVKWGGRA